MFKAELCNLCGDCLVNCMFNEYTREEAVAEWQALMEGKWAPILHNCASCHACNESCSQGANPWDLIAKLQGIHGEVKVPEATVERNQKVDDERARVLAGPPPGPVEVVLATCTLGETTPQVFDSLLYADLPKLVGPAYYCTVTEFFGDEEGSRTGAQGFMDAFARYQPKEVVCYHDVCYHLLAFRMPEYGIEVPFRPVHIFEHLLGILRKHRGRISPLNLKIAYQRPCSSRSTPWKEPLLDELLELIGCERVARRYDRENALCCGAMLDLRGLADGSGEAAMRNIEDSLAHGAEALAYLCHGCLRRLGELRGEHDLPLYHISELCQMAIGEK